MVTTGNSERDLQLHFVSLLASAAALGHKQEASAATQNVRFDTKSCRAPAV
jgi:hypothetical protein